jgi:hypothetical protein
MKLTATERWILSLKRNKVFGLQLNGHPYPAPPAAHAEAPAPTFTLDGHKYCTTQGSGYIYIKPQPEGTPNSQVAEIEMEGGGVQNMVHTSTGHVYCIPNEDIIMQHFRAMLATQIVATEEQACTNSNGHNRNNGGPFIPPNPEQQELLDHLVTCPTVSSNVNTKVLHEMRAIIHQTRDPRLALAALKDSFQSFLARIHTDRVVVAHEYLHQFMVHYQYVVPHEDLEDLKNLVLDIRGCQNTLFHAGWMNF